MPKTGKTKTTNQKPVPKKRKIPAYILAVYTVALLIANSYKPQWFVDLDWWVYLPLLPIEIWFLIAYKKD
ncbi:MAG: hypothetical protein K8R77_00215 [Anaerolineaceae bacterium]|nr:hypothetical protein [Anaerolineaceae bacterium]